MKANYIAVLYFCLHFFFFFFFSLLGTPLFLRLAFIGIDHFLGNELREIALWLIFIQVKADLEAVHADTCVPYRFFFMLQ